LDSSFPSESVEKKGRWVGIEEYVGDALTYRILTDDTNKVIPRSAIRSALASGERNLRANPDSGEISGIKPIKIVKDRHDHLDSDLDESVMSRTPHLPTIDPNDLIGRTFLMSQNEDGTRYRARVTNKIVEDTFQQAEDPAFERVKFLLEVDDEEKTAEIVGYNELVQRLNQQIQDEFTEDGEQIWKFRQISGHQGPLASTDPSYKGCNWNVLVEWETGEVTYEPLNVIAQDDPVTCAIYAKNNGLLDTPGWKRFKNIAKRQKRMLRELNQSKLRQVRRGVKYKFGIQIPRDYQEAVELDKKNGNTKWQDAVALELSQIDEYHTFEDIGKAIYKGNQIVNAPQGYKKIRVHLVFDVKHDGRHKARLVADGHLTSVPVETVYSSVVSLRSLRIVTFLNELNKLELWGADIGNAYLEAYTSEKLYIIAGPEFGQRKGNILIIRRALYGLRSSGRQWHGRFAECMNDLKFKPCKVDPDVWMRKAPSGRCYEYVAVYVDDLLISMEDPAKFCKALKERFNFKLKGDGPITYHLGLNYIREKDGILCQQPLQYIDKMMATYKQMFGGELPKKYKTPLDKGDHPELDDSELLDPEGIAHYLTMIGQIQWCIALGRLDLYSACVTMSSFRPAPRVSHLTRLKRIYGYILDTKHAAIRVRTDEPDFSMFPDQVHDWKHSICGEVKEQLPTDAPEPLGKEVVLTTYVDANLYHDFVTGRSLTAVLHLINQTPFDWYCKKQTTVETATFGSEFNAARSAVDQIVDIRTTLRYFGVPIKGKTHMFGDNQSVVTNSTIPHSVLNKRHQALAYHRVREAVASDMISFHHIDGTKNPADIMSKIWGFQQVWPQLKALLFWRGETKDISSNIAVRLHVASRGEYYISHGSGS
jgi:hypothetical protein